MAKFNEYTLCVWLVKKNFVAVLILLALNVYNCILQYKGGLLVFFFKHSII